MVQCFNNAVRNDWGRPWTVQSPSSLSGSGFIISLERRLIVTNAHVVSFARTFQVRRDGDFDKYESKILAASHQVRSSAMKVSIKVCYYDAKLRSRHCMYPPLNSSPLQEGVLTLRSDCAKME